MATAKSYKLVLVGDKKVGKTTFLKRWLIGQFRESYFPTLGVEVIPLIFNSNYGLIYFDVWDFAGDENFKGTEDYKDAKGAIIMFDNTSVKTYENIQSWYDKIKNYKIPTVLCGTKTDENRKVKPEMIDFHRKNSLQYYDISAKSNYNYEKPFLYLAQKLISNDLQFI